MEPDLLYDHKPSEIEISWDKFSVAYSSEFNRNTTFLMSNLITLSKAEEATNILDAGCGPGLCTKLITTRVKDKGANIFAVDFSQEMISLAKKEFEEYDDFNYNKSNYCGFNTLNKKINIESYLKEIRQNKDGKVVIFSKGDVLNLNFEDNQFDVYLSNLCFQALPNADNAILEAYRVLKPNGVAAISVVGKEKDSNLSWEILNKFLLKMGGNMYKYHSPFTFSENEDELKLKFINAKFKEVRIIYVDQLIDCYNEQDYLMKFQNRPQYNDVFKELKDTQVKIILESVKDEAKEKFYKEKLLPKTNHCIIIAKK